MSTAHAAALRYLIDRPFLEGRIDETALYPMYRDESDLAATPARVVAWQRRSRAEMAAMKEAGLLRYHYLTFITLGARGRARKVYTITDAGRDAAAGAPARRFA